ncbi:hypothetical protein [Stenotrophomonas sp. BIO128-Bstrain]|uniref:hypothetical protein n=1 Tax=Stenotrophomonas sp. BIO128-Bstrain TaxID=3027225 RepID=UPI0024DEF52C|nr:hypothetical protein [Stenotrophomonas sp. BIO128-Bstrain]WIA62267.1 hypothetical protein POS15_03310 [Stenotrophomonas sp. BIO128-Bstrain]
MAAENYRAPSVAQSAELAEQQGVWPFVESPGEFTARLREAIDSFHHSNLLGAVRHVLIEKPPTLAATGKQQVGEVKGDALAHALEVLRVVTGRAMQGSETRLAYETVRTALAHQQSAAQVVGHVSRDSSKAHMCVNLPEGSPLYALAARQPRDQEAAVNAIAECLYCAESSATMEDARERAALLLAEALPHLAARQPGAQVPVAFMVRIRAEGDFGLVRLKDMPYYRRHANEYEIVPLYAAPPAQGIGLGQVREIRIPARNNLDPISVFVQDQAAGRGRIVVTCYGNAWQAFWGAMGNRTVMEFVAQCDADYVAGNMISGRQTRMTKAERAYTERIATEVIAEFRALRDGQRDAAPGVSS